MCVCVYLFSKEITFSAAFPEYFMLKCVRLLAFLSIIFITCLPYSVVQPQRTGLGPHVEEEGMFLPNI